jgi:hypothetical protein
MCKCVDWVQLTQDPVAGSCEHGSESLDSIKGREGLFSMDSAIK